MAPSAGYQGQFGAVGALRPAERLAENAPLAPAAVKRVVRAAEGAPESDVFAFQRGEMAALTASADVREGQDRLRRTPRRPVDGAVTT